MPTAGRHADAIVGSGNEPSDISSTSRLKKSGNLREHPNRKIEKI
jgi:hypothetical protein